MKSKKILAIISAALILLFHLYIPATTFGNTLLKLGYIGVDIFFFLAGYSLGSRKNFNIKEFYINRFINVYVKYILFTIIAVLVSHYSLMKVVRILTGVELFKRGGGAFLWFVPAIVITYIFAPLMIKIKEKLKLKGFILLLLIWLIIVSIYQYVLNERVLMIYLMRLPIIFIGLYYNDLKRDYKHYLVIDILVLIASSLILWKYGTLVKLNVPFNETYYLLDIPFILALVDILEHNVKEIKGKIFTELSSITLEIYAFQMILGYDILGTLLKVNLNKQLAFLVTSIILVVISIIFGKVFNLLKERITK